MSSFGSGFRSGLLTRLRPYVLLFCALNVVYHANLRPIDSSDSLPASLLPFSLALDHSITLDRFMPWLRSHVWYTPYVTHQAHGHFFSSYPIGGPLLVSPLYLPAAFAGLREWDVGALVILARIVEKFAASAVAAFSAVLLLLLLQRIASVRWAWILTLVYALATETWSISSQALWQHGGGNLAIIGSLLCLELWSEDRSRAWWLWLSGGCAAAALTIRPTNAAVTVAIFTALALARATWTQQIRFLSLPLLGAALLGGYNWYVFHRLSGGYAAAGAQRSVLPVIAGLFLSPGRGLLIYTPVVVFAGCAYLRGASDAWKKHAALLTAATCVLIFEALAISASTVLSPSVVWWGGYCWGPRMLTELAPALIVLMAFGVAAIDRPWPRRAFAVLALYSMLTQAVGVFFYPKGHWDGLPQPVDTAHGRLWDWRDNPITRSIQGGFYWESYSTVGAALTGGLPAAAQRMHELNLNPYEQAQPGKDAGLP